MTTPDDRDIVGRVLNGDRNAFETLVDRHLSQVFSLALRLTGSRTDAEDLSQEVFARAFARLALYDPHRPFFTWLYTLALNLIRNHLRRSGRRPDRVAPAGDDRDLVRDEAPGPSERLEGRDAARRIQAGLDALPLEAREALVLRFFQDLDFQTMAGVLGVSTSAAKMRVYRGMALLRQRLTDE